VRPDSRTKVSVPLVLPQTRHPERSASQIDCVIQRLGAESKDLGGAYLTHAARSFRPPKPDNWICCDTHWMVTGTRGDPAPVQARWFKSSEQHGLNKHRRGPSTPRPSAVSRNQSVRRSAQDDESVGVWTKDDESVGVSAKKLSEQVSAYGA
jgi:hypothetical protein